MNTITNCFDRQSLWNWFSPSQGSSFSEIATNITLFAIGLLILSCQQKITQTKLPIITSFEVKEVSHIDKKMRKELVKTIDQWKDFATEQSKNPDISTVNKERLLDSVKILIALSTDIPYENSRVFTCLDTKTRTLQSIAVLENNNSTLQLELLATNPHNLIPNPSAIKGSGSRLIHHLFQICLQESMASIKLTSLKSSVTFYKKLGFEELNKTNMLITSEKIKELMLKGCFPKTLIIDEIPLNPVKAITAQIPISFKVKEISTEDKQIKQEIVKTIKLWKAFALEQVKRSNTTPNEIRKLSDSVIILNGLQSDVLENFRVFACYETKTHTLQSIATAEYNLELNLLATNPHNLFQNEKSIRGAGSNLMQYLFQKCHKEGITSIEVCSLKSAVSFYMNLGFEKVGSSENSYNQILVKKF